MRERIGLICLLAGVLVFSGCGNQKQEAGKQSSSETKVEEKGTVAGTQMESGIFSADYVDLGEGISPSAVMFASDGNLLVGYYDTEGTEQVQGYEIASGTEVTEKEKISEEVAMEVVRPDYYENLYLGERQICEGGDTSVSYNDYNACDTDGMVRIYVGQKLMYRGLTQPTITFVSGDVSEDGRYIALLITNGDANLGDETTTSLYVVDTTLLSPVEVHPFPAKEEMVSELKSRCHVDISTPTKAELTNMNVQGKAIKGEATEYIAQIYAMFTRFPDAFYEELYSADRVNQYQDLEVYLIGEFSDGGEFPNAVGIAETFPDTKLRRIFIQCDGDYVNYVTLAAHEFMHILDNDIIENSTNLDEWNNFNPEGFGYDTSYEADEGGTQYTLEDTTGNSEVYFVTSYGLVNATEDRATVFETMFSDKEEDMELLRNHPKLKAKADYLAKALKKSFPSLKKEDSLWWENYKK